MPTYTIWISDTLVPIWNYTGNCNLTASIIESRKGNVQSHIAEIQANTSV